MCCFVNDPNRVRQLRRRKTPIVVWKVVCLSDMIGLPYTEYHGSNDRVWWIPDTIVKPPGRTVKPLQGRVRGSRGLYFFRERKSIGIDFGRYPPCIVKAQIEPQHVLGTGKNGIGLTVILASQAYVIEATQAKTISQVLDSCSVFPPQVASRLAKIKRRLNRSNSPDPMPSRNELNMLQCML